MRGVIRALAGASTHLHSGQLMRQQRQSSLLAQHTATSANPEVAYEYAGGAGGLFGDGDMLSAPEP